jgi:hypothetical protein
MTTPAVQVVDLSVAVPDQNNARQRDERAKGTLAGSLKEFGPARSIVLDANNVVRAGNGTLEQAAAAGVKRIAIVDADADTLVAVRRKDWSDAEARAYAIADNRTGDLSTFDYERVQDELRHLAEQGHDELVKAAGFVDGEIDKLLPPPEEPLDTSPQLGGMQFRIVIDCDNEAHQVRLLERFNGENLKCRALMS